MPYKRAYPYRKTKITRRKRLRRASVTRYNAANARAAFTGSRTFTTSRVMCTAWQVDANIEHDLKILQFTLSDLVNYTEYTALWNEYRINWVDVTFIFNRNNSQVPDPSYTSIQLPNLITAADPNDATIPAFSELMQIPNVRVDRLDKVIKRRVYPKASLAAYSGAFTSYANAGKVWLDTNSPGVRYYGLKIDVNSPVPHTGGTTYLLGAIQVYLRYNMSFRHPK